jgi:hypothetical protein
MSGKFTLHSVVRCIGLSQDAPSEAFAEAARGCARGIVHPQGLQAGIRFDLHDVDGA